MKPITTLLPANSLAEFCCGNVVGYWDESGSLVAEYAYDAFGNTISSSGPMAEVFPHRFSTKYHDSDTDLYYYGYRYYSPSLGRWLSRDPIEEEGGLNLYAFCGNSPFCYFDALGHKIVVFSAITTSSEKDALKMQMEIRAVDEWVDNKVTFFRNWTSFDSLVARNRFRINHEPFSGSREEFIKIVEREKESFLDIVTPSDSSSLIRHIESRVTDMTKPYDKIGIILHGGWDPVLHRPDGNVWMKNAEGSEISFSRQEFAAALDSSAVLKVFKDKIVIVSCFQSWTEPVLRPGESEEDAAARSRKETLEYADVTLPNWKCMDDQTDWYYNFEPFRFVREYGGQQ